MCPFPTIKDAVDTVITVIQSGIPVARIELLDEVQMGAVVAYSKLDYAVAPTLFFEFHGTPAGVKEQAEMASAIAAEYGGVNFQWAEKPEDRSRLWQARHEAYYAALALRPGSRGWPTDVCVPISKLAECIVETKADLAQSSLMAPLVGSCRRRQFPPRLRDRSGQPGRNGRRRPAERTHGHAGAGDGRHLHR